MFIPAARRQTVPVTYLTKKCVCVNCCCCRCCCVHDFSEVKWTKKKYFHRAVDPFFFFSSCLGYFSHAIVCGNERTNEIKIESWPFFPSPPRVLREKIFFSFFFFFFSRIAVICRPSPLHLLAPFPHVYTEWADIFWVDGGCGCWEDEVGFIFFLFISSPPADLPGIVTIFLVYSPFRFSYGRRYTTHTSLVRYPVPYLSWGRGGGGRESNYSAGVALLTTNEAGIIGHGTL